MVTYQNLKQTLSVFIFLFLTHFLSAQIAGGREPGQFSPQVMEPKMLSGDQFLGNVNLFNGTYQGSYTLGSVSTPGGLSFELKTQYSSALSGGTNVPVATGIPYGEGWNLSIPSIRVDQQSYTKVNAVNRSSYLTAPSPNSIALNLDDTEGDLFWHSVQVNIPGKLSCRAIFKYTDVDGQKIFVPNAFENYAEIILSGNRWRVILEDGTTYHFATVHENANAPANDRGAFDYSTLDGGFEVGDQLENQITPKVSVLKWLCTQITNPNIPNQSIGFYYEKFGKFDFFKEYQQAGIKKRYQELFQMDEDFSIYRDVLLTSIRTEDPFSSGDELVLEYHTQDRSIGKNSTNMLKIGDNGVKRYDSLYNYKTVYLRGNYNAADYHAANNHQGNFIDWHRYYHAAHDDLARGTIDNAWSNGVVNGVHPSNPYIEVVGTASYYNRKKHTHGGSSIAFDHCYLETERLTLDEQWISGDLYEIRSEVSSNNGVPLNLDFNVVTGRNVTVLENSRSNNSSIKRINPNHYNSGGAAVPAKESVFSTFSSAVKWNTRGETELTPKNSISTSNFFSMPNLPEDHNGIHIQIGPANSDHLYNANVYKAANSTTQTPVSARSAYNTYHSRVGSMAGLQIPYHQRVASNFGLGMPWFMVRTLYKGLGSNAIDKTAYDYHFWMNLSNKSNGTWANEPTLTEVANLHRLELIRYSKNPYMLSSVKKYVASGEFDGSSVTGKVLVSQLDLKYTPQNHYWYDNKPYMNGDPLAGRIDRQRYAFLLTSITNVPTDPSGTALTVNTNVTPTTHFTYQPYNQNHFNEDEFHAGIFYLLTGTVNALGKETKINYHNFKGTVVDTMEIATLHKYSSFEATQRANQIVARGEDQSIQYFFMVNYIQERTGNNSFRTWNYEYSLGLETFAPANYVRLTSNFEDRGGNVGEQGYLTTKVYEPVINGKRNYTLYKHYDKSILSGKDKHYGGKLKSIEKYNHDNTLVEKQEFDYEVVKAYESGFYRLANQHEHFPFDYTDYFLRRRPTNIPPTTFEDFSNNGVVEGLSSKRYKDFRFGEGSFKNDIGQDDLASYFVKKVRDKSTTYDPDGCFVSGTISFNTGSSNNIANAESYPQPHVNGAIIENEEALITQFRDAPTYVAIKSTIVENSPLSDALIEEVLLNKNLHEELGIKVGAEQLSSDMVDFFNWQNPLSDASLHLMLQDGVLGDAKLFSLYLNQFDIPLTEATFKKMITHATVMPASQLQVKLSGHNSHTNEVLLPFIQKTPAFSQAMIEGVLLSQQSLSDTVLLEILNGNLEISGQRIENILLHSPDYPTTQVLNLLIQKKAEAHPQEVMNVLQASNTALPTPVMQTVNNYANFFNAQSMVQLQYVQQNAPAHTAQCNNSPQQQSIAIENIVEYEYYDANHEGISTSKGYLDVFGSDNASVKLKYEPSWQLYSTKSYSPQYPGAFQEARNYYYYDLKNRYDRYDIEYPTTVNFGNGNITLLQFTNTDSSVIAPNHISVTYPTGFPIVNPDGMDRSYRHRIRTIPYQQMSISDNGTSGSSIKKSKYFVYNSRWGDQNVPFSQERTENIDDPSLCNSSSGGGSGGGGTTTVVCTGFQSYNSLNIRIVKMLSSGLTVYKRLFDNIPPNHFIIEVIGTGGARYYSQHIDCIQSSYGPDTTVVYDPSTGAVDQGTGIITNPEQITQVWDLSEAMLLSSVYEQVDTIYRGNDSLPGGATAATPADNPAAYFGNTDLMHFIRTNSKEVKANVEYREFNYFYHIPYDYIQEQKILQRNVFTQALLTEDRIGIRTRYVFDPLMLIKRRNTACNTWLSNYYDRGKPNRPNKVVYGAGRFDSLTTVYEYYDDLSVRRVEELDHNTVQSYKYDAYGRRREDRRNGVLMNRYNYGFWDNDATKNFEERAADNYLESIHFPNDSTSTAVVSKQYADPLGRTFQTLNGELPQGINSTTVLSAELTGRTVFDNRDRIIQQYKPFGYEENGTPFALSPKVQSSQLSIYPSVAEHFAYEDEWEGRLLAAAKVGQSITGNRKVTQAYELMNSYCFACELSLSNLEISLLFPKGLQPNYVFSKQLTTDEDGKQTEVYSNALGQTVATRQYTGTEFAVTLTAYDKMGNATTVINPNNQRSDYRYNIMGWMYEQQTTDGGLTRYRYNKLGQVTLKQDEKGSQGRNFLPISSIAPQAVYSYVTLFDYDDYGRLTAKGEAYVKPVSGFLGSPYSNTLVITSTNTSELWNIYKFTNNSTYEWASKAHYIPENNIDRPHNGGWSYIDPNQPFNPIDPVTNLSRPDIKKVVIDPLQFVSTLIPTVRYSYRNDLPLSPLNLRPEMETEIHARTNLTRRLNYSVEYSEFLKENGNLTEVERIVGLNFYSYTGVGELKELIRQFNPNGLAASTSPEMRSIQHYSGFNNDGIWATNDVDILADQRTDIQFHREIDARGRIESIYANYIDVKAGGNKIVSYAYDNVFGRMTSKKNYYTEGITDHITNTSTYSYDLRDRLTAIDGDWFDYNLYYDNNKPNHAGHTPAGNTNYNGNINGIKASYTLTNASNYTSGSLFDEPTVYGYTYDPMNRLRRADAAVGDFTVGTSPSHISYLFGDVHIAYDKIGNLTSLKRYTDVLARSQNWVYHYMGQSNKLNNVSQPNGNLDRSYTYDVAGNLLSDNKREIHHIDYTDDNLAMRISKLIPAQPHGTVGIFTDYYYDAEGNRIYKNNDDFEANDPNAPIDAEYYLRDAAGQTIGIYDLAANNWEYFVNGSQREAKIQPWQTLQPGFSTTVPTSNDEHYQLNHYAYDHLGNTRVVVQTSWENTSGHGGFGQVKYTLQGAYDYYPYGKILRKFVPGGGTERYLTTGHERDKETESNTDGTGLDNRGARFYDSDIARFLSLDPAAAEYPSLSDYNYVAGNPVMFIDPDGKRFRGVIRRIYRAITNRIGITANGQVYRVRGPLSNPVPRPRLTRAQMRDFLRQKNTPSRSLQEKIQEFVRKNPSRENSNNREYDREATVDGRKHPESARHIRDAQNAGQPEILTTGGNARANRRESLRGIETRENLDRDEYPPARFKEGGKGASVRHIPRGDNRGSGSALRHQLNEIPDNTRVKITPINVPDGNN